MLFRNRSKVDKSVLKSILKENSKCISPLLSFYAIKLKVLLEQHTDSDLDSVLEITRELPFELNDEILNLLIDGWSSSDKLRDYCVEAITQRKVKFIFKTDIAWKILFHCFNGDETTADLIIKEITNNDHPFVGICDHHGWPLISHYFSGNSRLIPVIDDWISKQKYNEPEIAFASLIGRTDKSKKQLIDNLTTSSIPHWYTMALVKGWPEDRETLNALMDYFQSDKKQKSFAAGFIPQVFGDKALAKEILEEILFNEKYSFRERAISPLIEIDQKYFEKNILDKFLDNELNKYYRDDAFNSYLNALLPIAQAFPTNEKVKSLVKSEVNTTFQLAGLAIENYHEDAQFIHKLINISLPLSESLVTQIVNQLGDSILFNPQIPQILSSFELQMGEQPKTQAAIHLFTYLNLFNKEHLVEIASKKVFMGGWDYEVQRQIAFVGYTILGKLREYFELKEAGGEGASPDIDFYSYRVNAPLANFLIDNFKYLYEVINGDIKKLKRLGSHEEQHFWSFIASYSDKGSQSYEYIMEYIKEHINEIVDLKLIQFLRRTSPNGQDLKRIALTQLDNNNVDIQIICGEILGSNFHSDDNIKKILISKPLSFTTQGRIVALAIGWTDEPIIKAFYEEYKGRRIHLHNACLITVRFTYRSSIDVFKSLEYFLENRSEIRYHHKEFYTPLISRCLRDKQLTKKIRTELFKTSDPSKIVSYYSILQKTNQIDEAITIWINDYLQKVKIFVDGYNIVTNDIIPLKEIPYHL